jgi:hypothetical protein
MREPWTALAGVEAGMERLIGIEYIAGALLLHANKMVATDVERSV